jgi:hypothetical protein
MTVAPTVASTVRWPISTPPSGRLDTTTETAGTGVFPLSGIGRSLVMLTGFGGN